MRAHSVSLRDFHGKASGDKLSLLLNEEDTTIDNVWSMLDIATRYLYVVDDDEGTPMMQTLLQKWLVSIAFDKPSQLTYLSRALQWFTKDGNRHAKVYLAGLNGIERVVTEITHSFSRVDKRSIEKLKSILSDLVLNDNDYDNDDISNANEEDLVVKRLLSFIDAAEVILYRKEMLEISLRELSESSANEAFAFENFWLIFYRRSTSANSMILDGSACSKTFKRFSSVRSRKSTTRKIPEFYSLL